MAKLEIKMSGNTLISVQSLREFTERSESCSIDHDFYEVIKCIHND